MQVWRYQGALTLASFLRKGDALGALSRGLAVPRQAVAATVLQQLLGAVAVSPTSHTKTPLRQSLGARAGSRCSTCARSLVGCPERGQAADWGGCCAGAASGGPGAQVTSWAAFLWSRSAPGTLCHALQPPRPASSFAPVPPETLCRTRSAPRRCLLTDRLRAGTSSPPTSSGWRGRGASG